MGSRLNVLKVFCLRPSQRAGCLLCEMPSRFRLCTCGQCLSHPIREAELLGLAAPRRLRATGFGTLCIPQAMGGILRRLRARVTSSTPTRAG